MWSITTDMWTTSANQPYMGITAHWILDRRQRCYAQTLSCCWLASGSHTAEYISTELKKCDGKVVARRINRQQRKYKEGNNASNCQEMASTLRSNSEAVSQGCAGKSFSIWLAKDYTESTKYCQPLLLQPSMQHGTAEGSEATGASWAQTYSGLSNPMELTG